MWFKNLQLYRLTGPFPYSPEELHERLQPDAARPCGTLETQTIGWVPPLGRHGGTQLTHAAAGFTLVCARKEERVLPSAVIRDQLAERVAAIEDAEQRPVRRKERQSLKDELVHELLPKAFTRSRHVYAYVDPRDGWLVVDAASAKAAEEVVSLLRQSLGSLSVAPPVVNHSPSAVMTAWLSEARPPEDVELGDECVLKDPAEEGGVVRCRRQDLLAQEVQAHLEAGKRVNRLAVTYDQRIACVLTEELAIKRVGFEDQVQEALEGMDSGDAAALFDAQFALMTLEFSRFLPRLLEWFGGEEAGISAA